MTVASLQRNIRRLYEGATPSGVRFRYALLAFDIVTVLFIIATSFLHASEIIETFDVLFGVVILADFSARLLVSRHRLRDFTRFSTWTDLGAIVSFLAPLAGEAIAIIHRALLIRQQTLSLRDPLEIIDRFAVGVFRFRAPIEETKDGHGPAPFRSVAQNAVGK